MIYFIQAGRSAVKIGYTKNIMGRYTAMQTDNYNKLVILYLVEGDVELEGKLHYTARKYRIRNEWYKNEVLKDKAVIGIVNKATDLRLEFISIDFYRKYGRKLKQAFIRELREAKGWSQEDLSLKIGVNERIINMWENGGKILTKYREKLRDALDY